MRNSIDKASNEMHCNTDAAAVITQVNVRKAGEEGEGWD